MINGRRGRLSLSACALGGVALQRASKDQILSKETYLKNCLKTGARVGFPDAMAGVWLYGDRT